MLKETFYACWIPSVLPECIRTVGRNDIVRRRNDWKKKPQTTTRLLVSLNVYYIFGVIKNKKKIRINTMWTGRLVQYEQRVEAAYDRARIGHQVFLIGVAEHGDEDAGRVRAAPQDGSQDDEAAERVLQVDEDGQQGDQHDRRERVAEHGERGRERDLRRVGHGPQQGPHAHGREHGQPVHVAEHELAAGQQQQRRVRQVQRDRTDHVVVAEDDAALARRVQRVEQPGDDLVDVDAQLLQQRRLVLIARETRRRGRLPRGRRRRRPVQLRRLRVPIEPAALVVAVAVRRVRVEVQIVVRHEIRVVRLIVLVLIHSSIGKTHRHTGANVTIIIL